MAYPYLFENTDSRSFIVPGGYCTTEDVQNLIRNISGYSSLDADEITRRIADATVEIDRMLGINYIVPVSGDAPALIILRLICARLACAIIHETYYRSEEPMPAPEAWRVWAEATLAMIVSGDIVFASAPRSSSSSLPEVPAGRGATFNPDDDAALNPDAGPLFSRGNRGNLGALGDLI